jgi:hypothetical protein
MTISAGAVPATKRFRKSLHHCIIAISSGAGTRILQFWEATAVIIDQDSCIGRQTQQISSAAHARATTGVRVYHLHDAIPTTYNRKYMQGRLLT